MFSVSYDRAKRERTLAERGLDFEDAPLVFAGDVLEWEDMRSDYGERRVMCFGYLAGRAVIVGYEEREDVRHVFTMRKANDREKERYGRLLGEKRP